jgi:hypothetical protein
VKPDNTNSISGVDYAGLAGRPSIVTDLAELISAGHTFPTVLADPPWRYRNTSSRGAAENHYPTVTVEQICVEAIRQLVSENAGPYLELYGREEQPKSSGTAYGKRVERRLYQVRKFHVARFD